MPHNALIKYTDSKLVCSLGEGVQRMRLIFVLLPFCEIFNELDIVLLPFCEIFNELDILNTSELDFYKLNTPPANMSFDLKEAIFTM
jgi:hypothetical protein